MLAKQGNEQCGEPFLWGTTPDADYIGGMVLDPARWTVTASIGYPYFLGKVLGTFTRLGGLTPTAMIPVTFDAKTGNLMPGQIFSPELARPGISQANAMVTTHGRYVVQKAELLTLFYYYLFQGNYNFFNANAISRDDVTEEEMKELRETSAQLNYFGLFGPIDEEGIVPAAWKVPQPEAGLTIYEPVSFRESVRNQVEMNLDLVRFSRKNICLTEGCQLEEAAARLGYAAWNLDKAVPKQLAEAVTRSELSEQEGESLTAAASVAESECRRSRGGLLAKQPRLPDRNAIQEAQQAAATCEKHLQALLLKL